MRQLDATTTRTCRNARRADKSVAVAIDLTTTVACVADASSTEPAATSRHRAQPTTTLRTGARVANATTELLATLEDDTVCPIRKRISSTLHSSRHFSATKICATTRSLQDAPARYNSGPRAKVKLLDSFAGIRLTPALSSSEVAQSTF